MNQIPVDAGPEHGALAPATDGHFDPTVFLIFFFTFLGALVGLMLNNPKRPKHKL